MSETYFTPAAKQAITYARDVAANLGHGYIGSEHLLLSLLHFQQGRGAQYLRQRQIRAAEVRARIVSLVGRGRRGDGPEMGLTPCCRHVIQLAALERRRFHSPDVSSDHLLLGLLREREGMAHLVLTQAGLSCAAAYRALVALLGDGEPAPAPQPRRREPESARESRLLEQFTCDLTRRAAAGGLDPVIGREDVLDRLTEILCRRSKNNPVLLGEPGVGKTAVAEALAQRIADGNVPSLLQGRRVLSIDLSSTVAGTKYRGEFEERVKRLLREVQRLGNIILFVDELHTLMGAGSAEGSIDAADMLKPALSRGELQLIGATTRTEYEQKVCRDAAFARRLQPVQVEPPDRDTALAMLRGLRGRYEQYHRLTISDDALEAAVDCSIRYVPERFLPDKAIDLMDEAAAQARIAAERPSEAYLSLTRRHRQVQRELSDTIQRQDYEHAALLRDAELDFRRQMDQTRPLPVLVQVTAREVERVVSRWTGIPAQRLTEREAERYLHLEQTLSRRVIGQEAAVRAVAAAVRRSRAGLQEERRPVGCFLFAGSSGVGKTELCRALAEALFGTQDALLRLDMSEYAEAHTVSRLIGSPPGYVGHQEGGRLTQALRRRPYQVVLLDEIEKAHREVWHLLLQIMEEGCLTDAQGRRAEFRHAVLVLTTNAGGEALSQARRPLGFARAGEEEQTRAARAALSRLFPAELLGRLDEIVCFRLPDGEQVKRIAQLMVERTAARFAARGVALEVTERALERIAQEGRDPALGLRPIRGFVRREIEDRGAELLLSGALRPGDRLRIARGERGLALDVQQERKE